VDTYGSEGEIVREKALVLLMFFAVLFAASFMIEGETRSSLKSDGGDSASSGEKEVVAYYFYGQGCPHCKRVEPFINQIEQGHSLIVHKYEIYQQRNNVALLNQYFDMYAVPTDQRGIPAVFVSNSYLVGDAPILSRFEEVISELIEQDSLIVHTSDFEVDTPKDLVEENACSKSAGNSECLSVATVTIAALVDSVSPCSLAVLLFLVGVRPLVQDRRNRALKVGLAFTFSVFLTYTLFGLGLLGVLGITGLSSAFGVVAGLIAILAGILYLKDYFWHGGGGFAMEVPRSLRPLVNRMIKGVTTPVGAFLIGFVICCFELPCTGGPYLFILGQLADTATRLQTIPTLLYYNLLFIMPLLLISLFLYFGCFSLKKATEWNERNKRPLRLIGGLTITVLGIFVIPTSELIWLIRMFLSSCKVILPPVLFILSFYIAYSFLRIHQTRVKLLSKTMFLAALLLLSIFAFPQLLGNTITNVVANAAEPDTELATSEFPSTHAPDIASTHVDTGMLCDTSDGACGRPNEPAQPRRDSIITPERTRELTAEELAELEERAKLYGDETVNEVMEKASEDETKDSGGCDGKDPGTANPAAIYCIELGYEYKTVDTAEGQNGICRFPDNSECDEWKFLAGKCGQEYSYCAKQGYDLITKTDGKNPFSQEYAVCTYKGEEVGTVTDLFSLNEKAVIGSISTNDSESNKSDDNLASDPQAPSSFDWRNYGGENWITPVKNQNPCGSCWAFSTIGVTEALYNIYTGNPDLDLDLSEEFLVSDCFTDGTCCGGWHYDALQYIRDNGIPDEACFPYVDYGCHCTNGICDASPAPNWCNYRTGGQCSDATCSDRCADWQKRLTKIESYAQIPAGDLAAMKDKIVSYGPLSVTMGILASFGGYFDANNVYRCTDDTGVNHVVVIVGYDDVGGYWIVKNSWGATWGPDGDGFFKVGYGECDIEGLAYYAQPDTKSCGETITSNTILTNNLLCPGNGLIIGTSDITLDCQGYSIQGSGSGVGIDIDYNNVTIKNCIVRDFANGIYLHDVADYNTLIDNWFYSNEFHGIYLYDAWSNNISYNDVTYNGMNGLYFHDKSKYNDIIDNNFWFNGYHGIQLKGTSDSNDFSANYFYTNGWSGMGIDTDNNWIQDCTSRDNLYHGFDIRSTTGNRLIHNWIWYNDQYGIYLYNSTNTQITDDRILGNVYYGIYSSYSNYTTIDVSQFDSNLRIGVYLYHSNHNTIQTSYFHQNYNESIYLYYADDNFILDNDIQLSGTRGIDVRFSKNNIIQFNDVRDSANMGIYLYESDSNDVWSNDLDNNDGWSVYLLASDFNDFRHNIVNHPIDYGIYSSTSYNTVFQNNTVCGYLWDFYTPSSTYTADENMCDDAYQFADSGQPNACDFKCSGCRRLEDNLYAYRDLVFCPGTYSIQDTGADGVVRVQANSITLTCNNTILDGVTDTGFGIYILDHSFVTVENCVIQNFERGVILTEQANYNSLINNEITSNSYAGVHVLRSRYNGFADNTISLNDFGIRLFNANYTNVGSNLIESNDYGIYMLSDSSNNLINGNTVCANTVRDIYDDLTGLSNTGDLNYCDAASNYVDNGQTSGCDFECSGCRKAEDDLYVSGDTVLCPYTYNLQDAGSNGVIIIGAHGVELDCQGAELIAVSAGIGYGIRNIGYDNVIIRNCKIYNYFIAIDFISGANDGNILNNDVRSNAAGIRLWGSNYGYIIGNTANLNTQYGIILTQNSDFNTITDNVAEVNSVAGISAYAGSDSNVIQLNHAANNYRGIYIYDSGLNYVHNNIVEGNTNTGVYFTSAANNNDLYHNRVCGNGLDISDADANFGDDNFCGTTSNYDDTGTTGCSFSCFFGDIQGDVPGTPPDGDVDYFDFLAFAASYLKTSAQPDYNPGADFDVDGDVDYDDFLIFAGNYLKTSATMPGITKALKNTRPRIQRKQ